MEIIYKKTSDLIPYEKNPRINDESINYVANSIKKFGFKVPIIIDKNNVIICGHTRYKASQKVNIDEVPCIIADDLTEEQIKAFRLADNKVGEFSQWDEELLKEELNDIFNVDMSNFGFFIDDLELIDNMNIEDNPYTSVINIPQYEITKECPKIEELVDITKSKELIEEIEKSNISEEEKNFLIEAAKRHSVFNYRNIAEYYAYAGKEMQCLMEKSGLVIIDFDEAIRNGFVELRNDILNMEYDELDGENDE